MIVLDTHALIWAANDDPSLGPAAHEIIESRARKGTIGVSAITPWEIAVLVERGRLRLERDAGDWIEAVLALPGVTLLPVETAIAVDAARLPGDGPADTADRLIVATARHHGAQLLTADDAILDYGSAGHVQTLDARS